MLTIPQQQPIQPLVKQNLHVSIAKFAVEHISPIILNNAGLLVFGLYDAGTQQLLYSLQMVVQIEKKPTLRKTILTPLV